MSLGIAVLLLSACGGDKGTDEVIEARIAALEGTMAQLDVADIKERITALEEQVAAARKQVEDTLRLVQESSQGRPPPDFIACHGRARGG